MHCDAADEYATKNNLSPEAASEFNNTLQDYADGLRIAYRIGGATAFNEIYKYLDASGNSKTSSTLILKKINLRINQAEENFEAAYNGGRTAFVIVMGAAELNVGPGPKGIKTPPVITKSNEMGKIIGWGETSGRNVALAVQTTRQVAQNLTRAQVQAFANRGLTKQWVQSSLKQYNSSLLNPAKNQNTLLQARKELLDKILYLWK